MNQNLECSLQHQNGPPTDHQKLASERAAALREEEWQLHNECITLAREALGHYKAQGEKRLRIPDLARIIDLASRLGRLATGIPTEHIEHAWSEYQNQLWTAQFEADTRKIYGQLRDSSALPGEFLDMRGNCFPTSKNTQNSRGKPWSKPKSNVD